METRKSAKQDPVTLGRRFAVRRLHQALENWAPEIVERLHRHATSLARIARIGFELAEQATEAIRRGSAASQTETEYWNQTQQAADVQMQSEGRNKGKARGSHR
jgi:hypothetical protein